MEVYKDCKSEKVEVIWAVELLEDGCLLLGGRGQSLACCLIFWCC